MNKFLNLRFEFDKTYPCYLSGETITGRLIVVSNARTEIKDIWVKLDGRSKVEWTEPGDSSVTYSRFQDYCSIKHNLMRNHNKDIKNYIEIGEFSYEFSILIPNNIPSSFEHTYGVISYILTACIESAKNHNELNLYQKLNIVGKSICINLYKDLKLPISIKGKKMILFQSMPIIASLSLPKSGYLCLEKIEFHSLIENQTGESIRDVNFKIIRKIDFFAFDNVKTEYQVISYLSYPQKILKKSNIPWDGKVSIPLVVATSNQNNFIIKISYAVLLTVNPRLLSTSLKLMIPITIGK